MYIQELVQELKSKTFAVIIDEAHSSTAGTAMEAVTYAPVSYTHLDVYKRQDVSKEVGLVWSIANSLRGAYTSDK